jgi:hypothetical protein
MIEQKWCFFLLFLNFSELFELTLTDPELAPPSTESCFSMNNYLFIVDILYVPPIPQQILISVDQPYAGPAASCCVIIGTHSMWHGVTKVNGTFKKMSRNLSLFSINSPP